MYYVYGLQLYVRNCIVHTAGTYTGARIMYLVYMKTSHVCGVPKNEKMRGNHTVGTEQDGLSTAALVFISTAQQLFDTAAGSSSRHSSSSSSHSSSSSSSNSSSSSSSRRRVVLCWYLLLPVYEVPSIPLPVIMRAV